MRKKEVEIKVGCCGFPVARARYQERFSLVEVQQTFYQPPREETARKWRSAAPSGFEFTVKAWQLITHEATSPTYRRLKRLPTCHPGRYGSFRPTEEVMAAWRTTARIADILEARVVLFQCPASFTPTSEHRENMHDFFSRIDRGNLLLAWEPRGHWPPEEVSTLCRDLGLIHCVDPFQGESMSGELTYFRLHGRVGYRYRYGGEDLVFVAGKARARGVPAYVLFNNISMFDDACRFSDLVGGEHAAEAPRSGRDGERKNSPPSP
ncbi:MAG TPA: DUF72 domain-containing protein [Geobacteraceae bacterium]